jgi:hypothetical protein
MKLTAPFDQLSFRWILSDLVHVERYCILCMAYVNLISGLNVAGRISVYRDTVV